MAREGWIDARLPAELGTRADLLVEPIQADPELRGGVGTVTRATVLRLALARGLASLEASIKARKAPRKGAI